MIDVNVPGVNQYGTTFEAFKKGYTASFDKNPDGSMRVEIDGFYIEVFHMSAVQVAAFKAWLMEN